MRLTPGDLLSVTIVATFAAALVLVAFRLFSGRRSRTSRLRLLTGTRSQQAAIVLAVRPVVRELLPPLETAGLEVSSIALLPSLVGPNGESLQAQVEQLDGTRTLVIRLAHAVSGVVQRPDEVAGALAHELLGLQSDAAAVTIVRQTPTVIPAATPVDKAGPRKDGRLGVAPQPRAAARDEAEGTVVNFRPSPLGRSANGQVSD
jgi:hypothetical protein